jgi:hypothetical protein
MTNFNNLCPIEAVFLEYNFKPFSRMVDVGGGLGAFSAAALATAPQLKGHLFDLPNVVKQAQEVRMTDLGCFTSRAATAAAACNSQEVGVA